MIQVNETNKEHDSFVVLPNDDMLRRYAHLNVGWTDMVTELINNIIQAAWDNNLDVSANVNFVFNDDDKLTEIRVKDNSGGIAKDNIARCMSPGYAKSEPTLNEHGHGLNFAIEYLTQDEKCSFELNSCHPIGSFQINQKPSFHNPANIVDALPRIDGTYGIELVFKGFENIETIAYPRYHAKGAIAGFWKLINCKYRYKAKEFEKSGKHFSITILETHPEKVQRIKLFEPILPVIVNPSNTNKGEWICSFTLSENDANGNECKIRVNLGVASLVEQDYNIDIGDISLSKSHHPYRFGYEAASGFDLFYKNVILKSGDLRSIPLIGTSGLNGGHRITYGDLRGEIHILKGGQSFFTKDGMSPNPTLTKLYSDAANILKGKVAANGAPKINYIKKYVERRSADAKYASEKIVKYRHRVAHKMSTDDDFVQETHNIAGVMDMYIADKLIVEHKVTKTTTQDVNQLFGYLIHHDKVPLGQLWSPEHGDAVSEHVRVLNNLLKNRNQKITLVNTPDSYTNPNLTETERNL